MAPVTKKLGAGSSRGGSGAKKDSMNTASKSSNVSSGSKSSGSSSLNKSSKPTSAAMSSSSSSASKNYLSPSYQPDKNKSKSSSKFGIIWIPTKRHNKKKDLVYNSQHNNRKRERSPSMYRFPTKEENEKSSHDTSTMPKALAGAGTLALLGDKKEKEELPSEESSKDMTKDDYKDDLSDDAEKDNRCVMCLFCCLDTLDCTIM